MLNKLSEIIFKGLPIMKLLVRVSVATLVLAGFVASSYSQQKHAAVSLSHQAVSATMPAPACGPRDPNACGVQRF